MGAYVMVMTDQCPNCKEDRAAWVSDGEFRVIICLDCGLYDKMHERFICPKCNGKGD